MEDVCKWGGSSLADGKRVLQVANFVKQNNIRIVVLSAPGKVTAVDSKITDILINITKNINDIDYCFEQIKDKYQDIITSLQINFDINNELAKIKSLYLKTKDNSYLISRGEYLMAKIFARYLKYKFIDSKNIIKFDKDGKLLDISYLLIKEAISKYKKVVIPGFYGSYKNNIKIFSRGGSDITGAIVAKSVNVNYSNFTDVDGVYNKYPLTQKAKKLKTISYQDMKFLGLFGFSVLHHKCCDILSDTNLKTYIKSTFEPHKRPTTLTQTKASINARATKEFVLAQSSGDIFKQLSKQKIFVYFRYCCLNKYFYLISKEDKDKLKDCICHNVQASAIVSTKTIKNAFYLENNHYLKITKKE